MHLQRKIPFQNLFKLNKRFISLYTKGIGVFGALGDSSLNDRKLFQEVNIAPYIPSKVVTGWGHSIILTTSGDLIVFGRPCDINSIMRINSLNENAGSKMTKSFSNLYFSIDPEAQNTLCMIPTVLESINNVKDVAASAALTVALTHDGYIYTFGVNRWGQCGTGNMNPYETVFQKIKNLSNMIAIETGFQHCISLSDDGKVYAWGKGSRGQLGDGGNENSADPILVSFPKDIIIKSISTGFAHSAALDNSGIVWVWGKGMSNEEKSNNGDNNSNNNSNNNPKGPTIFKDQFFPRSISLKNNRKIIEICSSNFNLIARADDNTLWMLGMGEYDRNRLSDFIQVHDVYTEDEINYKKEPRYAYINGNVKLIKGHTRITLLDNNNNNNNDNNSNSNNNVLQAVLHENSAFLQPYGLEAREPFTLFGMIRDLLNNQEQAAFQSVLNIDPIIKNNNIIDLSVGWKHDLLIVE